MQSRQLTFSHQDPTDWFIAASAIIYELVLITADTKLIKGAGSYSVFSN
jgi:PIN domain nuclease of toxin-antitoxin system